MNAVAFATSAVRNSPADIKRDVTPKFQPQRQPRIRIAGDARMANGMTETAQRRVLALMAMADTKVMISEGAGIKVKTLREPPRAARACQSRKSLHPSP